MTSAPTPLWRASAEDPAQRLPLQFLNGSDSPRQAITALALASFVDGTQPYSCSAEIQHLRAKPDGAPAPNDPQVVRRHTSESYDICMLAGPGWTGTFIRNLKCSTSVEGQVQVTAATPDLARTVLADIVTAYGQNPTTDDHTVPIGFWHLSDRGTPTRVCRDIRVPRWTDIRENYAGTAATRFDHLTDMTPAALGGSIVLMYGPPGTGKTTALRSLARSWRSWCGFEYVLDPEKLFSSSGYLMTAAVPTTPRDSEWSALILEDCDELLRSDAKSSTGQGMARLLNLSDGILGQGGRTLLIITTNEDVHRLHPAIVRPGRCLAQVEVGPLNQEEISRWNEGAADDLKAPATLAQLYAHASRTPAVLLDPKRTQEFTGVYL
ncbi:DUF5925 domain-containing protein [Kitasatospora sp. NPDC048540]|uniref:DUF5925 domain-containing protein n=1 Tax=unclassified Kitasatospora TaxID=2633591 RepID=UPI000689DD00|nr:DUF5925 domain-containing protein [Kitasatospora sp. MBT63]